MRARAMRARALSAPCSPTAPHPLSLYPSQAMSKYQDVDRLYDDLDGL